MSKNVVIVGGGFAGVTLAQRLEKRLPREYRLILLSEENYILFSPLLSEVVGASIMPGHCVAPIRLLLRRSEFLRGRVTAIDGDAKRISFDCGGPNELHYDQLVLACGVHANLGMIPGMEEHAFPLKTLGDALELRNRVMWQLEQAELEEDLERRRRLLSFAVVGGGPSGVEVAGAVDDLLTAACRYYPRIARDACRVSVIESSDRLLTGFPEKLARFAAEHMDARNIDLHLDAMVEGVEGDRVVLKGDDSVIAGTTICTIGAAPYPFLDNLPVEKEKGLGDR